ncbi:MAG TPA: DUF952 domain-containing protein [Flexilinea sp.]|nr:DUF952 domain-containing protein [Flexilinea sp.]
MVYHICTQTSYESVKIRGKYSPDSLEKEGFIHFSSIRQILETANSFYRGEDDLVLLEVDEQLTDQIRFERPADHREGLFPHYYGELPVELIRRVLPFPHQADGTFKLPEEIAES